MATSEESQALLSLLQRNLGSDAADTMQPPTTAATPYNAPVSVTPAPLGAPQELQLAQPSEDNQSLGISARQVTVTTGPPREESSIISRQVTSQLLTIYASQTKPTIRRMVAVNTALIAYSVKPKTGHGAIRIMHLQTAKRALLKGLRSSPADMEFAPESDLLAVVDETGMFMVWHIVQNKDAELQPQKLIQVETSFKPSDSGYCRVLWHPFRPNCLAVAMGNQVQLWDLHRAIAYNKAHPQTSEGDDTGPYCAQNAFATMTSENMIKSVTGGALPESEFALDLSFSRADTAGLPPNGQAIAVAFRSGFVRIYRQGADETFQQHMEWELHSADEGGVQTVLFCSAQNSHVPTGPHVKSSHPLLLTASRHNSHLSLWDTRSWECVQSLKFVSGDDTPLMMVFDSDPASEFIALAETHRSIMYVLRLEAPPAVSPGEPRNFGRPRFTSLTQFSVKHPILSLVVVSSGHSHDEEEKESQLSLYCVMTKEIENFSIGFHPEPADWSQSSVLVPSTCSVDEDGTDSADATPAAASPEGDANAASPPPEPDAPAPAARPEEVQQLTSMLAKLNAPSMATAAVPVQAAPAQKPKKAQPSISPQDTVDIPPEAAAVPTPATSNGLYQPPQHTPASSQQAQILSSLERIAAQQLEVSQQILASVEKQRTQLKDIKTEIARSETNVISRVDKMLQKYFDSHQQKERKTRQDAAAAEREKFQRLLAAISESLHTTISEKISKIIKAETQATLLPELQRSVMAGVEGNIVQQVSGALSAGFNQMSQNVRGTIPGILSSQEVLQSLSQAMADGGRHALVQAFAESLDTRVLPAFDHSCRELFGQLFRTFDAGTQHFVASMQANSGNSEGAIRACVQEQTAQVLQSLQQTTEALQAEITRLERTIQERSAPATPVAVPQQAPQQPPIEAQLDALISQQQFNAAFSKALGASQLPVLMHVCNKVDPSRLFSTKPLCLEQTVVLSLVQQLAARLEADTDVKISYLQEAIDALDPNAPGTSQFVPRVLSSLQLKLDHMSSLPNQNPATLTACRMLKKLISNKL